jgi:hypothetical protein
LAAREENWQGKKKHMDIEMATEIWTGSPYKTLRSAADECNMLLIIHLKLGREGTRFDKLLCCAGIFRTIYGR